ncbi:MAG: phage tail tape measure protein, partial [Marinilabiliales bacterium]
MAGNLERTAKLIFSGQDDVSRVMQNIGGNLDSFGADLAGLNDAVGNISQPFADLAKTVAALDLAIAAVGAAMVTVAVQQAGKFSDSFAEIDTLVDASESSMDSFKQSILDYASSSTQSFESVNTAIYQAISLGTYYKDSLAAVNAAEQLAVAGKADLVSTTELLVGSLNAYGASSDQAAKYSDYLFTTVRDGKTSISELGASMSNVTGIAANAGVGFDSLLAAVAALTATGTPTAAAVTGIKAALSNIIAPSKSAEDAAKALGISFNAQALEADGLAGFLQKVYEATDGDIAKMTELFGSTEALNAVMVLGKDSSGVFAKALEDMGTSAGATQAAFETMANNISLVNQQVANSANAALVSIGDPLLDGYRDLADSIVQIFSGITLAVGEGAFDPIFNQMNEGAAQLSGLFSDVADVLPQALENIDLTGVLKAFEGFGQAVAKLFDGVDLTTAEGLTEVLQEIIDTGQGLINFSTGMVGAIGPVVTTFAEWAKSFNDLDADSQTAAGNLTGFMTVVNQLSGPLGTMLDSFGGLSSALNIFATSSLVKSVGALPGLSTALTAAGTAAKSFVGILASPGGLLAVVTALAGTAVVKAIQTFIEWQEAEDEAAAAAQRAADSAANLEAKYADISNQVGITITSVEQFHQLIND